MNNQMLAEQILALVGGKENINSVANCVTRLRLQIKNDELVDLEQLRNLEGVLGIVEDETLQVVVGPGKSKKLAVIFETEFGISAGNVSWQENKEAVKSSQKDTRFKRLMRTVSNIFLPLLPGIIASGLLLGFANVIAQLQNQSIISSDPSSVWQIIRLLFSLFGTGFLGYFAIYTGVNSAKQFGATEALGGMIGAISISANVIEVARFFSLYNEEIPGTSILTTGKGGLLGVILGVWILSLVEKRIRKVVPNVVEIILTPTLSILIVGTLYVLAIMPVAGFASDIVFNALNALVNSPNAFVRVITGFVSAATFLPLVVTGLHHGVSAIYAVQLEKLGGVTLLPVLTQAGSGQVGAAFAIYLKAKKLNKQKLCEVISGSIPSGMLGVSEPLIYGVTLPLGKAFITAGLGAGFGGAFAMGMNVMSVAWGASGLCATPLMTAGPNGMMGIVYFLLAILISYIMGFIITYIFIKEEDVAALDI